MKKILIILALLSVSFTMKAPSLTDIYSNERYFYALQEYDKQQKEQELKKFLFHLSLRESSDNWKIYNDSGYMGKYQFGSGTLRTIGIHGITFKKFKSNPWVFTEELQEKAIRLLVDHNYEILEYYILKYEGVKINNVTITKSGIIAAAHIAGAYGVKRFLEGSGEYDPNDAYGTHLSDYLQEFDNYKI